MARRKIRVHLMMRSRTERGHEGRGVASAVRVHLTHSEPRAAIVNLAFKKRLYSLCRLMIIITLFE